MPNLLKWFRNRELTMSKRIVTNTSTQIKKDKLLKKMHNVFYLDISSLGWSRFICKGCSLLSSCLWARLMWWYRSQFVSSLLVFASHTRILSVDHSLYFPPLIVSLSLSLSLLVCVCVRPAHMPHVAVFLIHGVCKGCNVERRARMEHNTTIEIEDGMVKRVIDARIVR